ncbi:MAG: hypothetical protein KAZ87_05525 [Spirochaetes bacterium]|nr:hypothetical protein [Spirochaetota bacterium]
MLIYLVSDNAKLSPFIDAKKEKPRLFNFKEIKQEYQRIEPESILYIDVTSMKEADFKKFLKQFAVRKDIRYGIIDSKTAFPDIAYFFHMGFSDYIGKELLKTGVSVKRLINIENFSEIDKNEAKDTALSLKHKPALNGWKDVKSGSEYTFFFIFLQLDNQKELRGYFSGNTFNVFRQRFHDIVERKIKSIDGKIWMWEDFGGLILVPFDGKQNNIIEFIFRFYLDKIFLYADEMELDEITLSFKTVIHMGNTIYKNRGNTGTVIADSVNSIYHIGYKFADPDSFLITEEVKEFVPEFLNSFFKEAGEYEGRQLFRMRKFL